MEELLINDRIKFTFQDVRTGSANPDFYRIIKKNIREKEPAFDDQLER